MRKIDKSHILSTKYKHWEESIKGKHPEYSSSDHRFYYDIVMNLFHCQRGVCAYTEELLCDDDFYVLEFWEEGRFKIHKPQFYGALDHFDPSLKKEKAWLWDNFFMVQKDINDKHKRENAVDEILKPDKGDYDPFNLLEYDTSLHIFIANIELDEQLQERVNSMILILGINHPTVIKKRSIHLRNIYKNIGIVSSWDDESKENKQFFTSFEMFKQIKQTK